MMADMKEIRRILASEYGIQNERDLMDALKHMKKLDIGAMTAPVVKIGGNKHGDARSIA